MPGRMPQLSRCGQAVQQVVRAGFSASNRRATRRSGKPSAVKKRPDASRALPDRRLKITMCGSPDSGPPGRPGGLGATGCGVGRFARPAPPLTASWPLKSAGGTSDHAWSSCSRTPSCGSTGPSAAMSSTWPTTVATGSSAWPVRSAAIFPCAPSQRGRELSIRDNVRESGPAAGTAPCDLRCQMALLMGRHPGYQR